MCTCVTTEIKVYAGTSKIKLVSELQKQKQNVHGLQPKKYKSTCVEFFPASELHFPQRCDAGFDTYIFMDELQCVQIFITVQSKSVAVAAWMNCFSTVSSPSVNMKKSVLLTLSLMIDECSARGNHVIPDSLLFFKHYKRHLCPCVPEYGANA